MSALATVAEKILTDNLLQELIFHRKFNVTIADADIGSRKKIYPYNI